MKHQRTSYYLASLTVLASCYLGIFAGEEPERKDAPKPLPPETVKAWRDAGAEVGWMKGVPPQSGKYRFWQPWHDKAEAGAIPAFRFPERKAGGVLARLPDPDTPFGLDFHRGFFAGVKLKELAELKNLQALNFGHIEGEHKDLDDLARFKNLKGLYLFHMPVTDAEVKHLAGLKTLETLDLSHTQVTDAGLKELAGLTRLQALNLGDTDVTDAGLKALAGLKNLQWLSLQGTKVTAAGAASLQKELPKCKIFLRDD